MLSRYPVNSFVILNFQEFYRHLLQQKDRALRGTETEEEALSTQEDVDNLTTRIQRHLRLVLEEQSMNVMNQANEFATAHYQDAQYIMVALADEIFLNLKWRGHKQWEKNLLETQVFHTQIAGELFFKKLDQLLAANNPGSIDLAVVYLLALGLGFRGQYRGVQDQSKVAWYREQLFMMINRQPSHLFAPGRPHLFPDCYEHTLTESLSRGLPDIRVWIMSFATIMLTYVFVTYVLWYKLVRDIDNVMGYILQQAHYMALT